MRLFIERLALVFFSTVFFAEGICVADETKVTADFQLKNGEEVHFTKLGEENFLGMNWGAFELEVKLNAVEKFELSESGKVHISLQDATQFEGPAKLSDSSIITGSWELGARRVKVKDIASGRILRNFGPPKKEEETFIIVTDGFGNSFSAQNIFLEAKWEKAVAFVAQRIFGHPAYNFKWKQHYLQLPLGDGFVFLPFGDIRKVHSKEPQWEIELGNGKKLFIDWVRGGEIQWFKGTTHFGRFQLKPEDVKMLTVQYSLSAPQKPSSGIASKPPGVVAAVLTDNFGFSHTLKELRSYHISPGYETYGDPVVSGALGVTLSDGTESDIELSRLSSIEFKDNSLIAIKSRKGLSLDGELRNKWDAGFIGLVLLGDNRYWSYFPLDSLKKMHFQ